MPGIIKAVEPEGVAAQAGLRPNDAVAAINGRPLRDVIDAQFYAAETELAFTIERDGRALDLPARRAFGQPLGIEFEHPTFDIDIRRCNNLCPFCFVLQNAPKMRRTLYIKDDDYRYSFLFGHFVTLTNLSDEDWARLAEQRLSPLYVSVHATDLEVRRKCLRNAAAPDVLEQLRWLARHDIQAHTQLVVTPGLNDGPWLERSVRELASLRPDVLSVSVVPVGLTKQHRYGLRPHTPAEAADTIDRVEAWQRDYRARFGAAFAYCTDEWYLVAGRAVPPGKAYDGLRLEENGLGMVRNFLNEWSRVKRTELGGLRGRAVHERATLATAPLFAPVLARAAREFTSLTGIALDVLPVTNTKLGDTITVAGLMMGADIVAQARARDGGAGDPLILPRVTFDHPDGVALDDVSPLDIAGALGRPVMLADWMGDVVDAVTGRNALTFRPDAGPLGVPIVREGGWAVEKYL